MEAQHDQTGKAKIWEGTESSRAECEPRSLGEASNQSRSFGDDSIGLGGSIGAGEYAARRLIPKTITGKTLSQLKKLRQVHLAYIEAHQKRLKLRLEESEAQKEKILKELDSLEQEIIQFLEEAAEQTVEQ